MKIVLFILLFFVAVTACISGVLMIVSPADGSIMQLPLSMLSNSPFTNFLIPGLVLSIVVGGSNLLALVSNIQDSPRRYTISIAAGLMICGWIIVQMILINAFSWLQFVYLGIGVLTMLIAYQLKGKWAA